ncbi:GspH/FimT family protein [Pseudomonas fluvialis]|uniref:GspH/FimT family protein n=1 Tax=Pseudomonas fluvialis TaxID=1793966 RepID=UPI00370BC8BE
MPNHRPRGFTLVELLTTLLLLSILAHLAVPALARMQQQNRNQAALEAANNLLQYARSQAVLRRQTLNLCPSHDGVQCTTDWNAPWLLSDIRSGERLSYSALHSASGLLRWSGFSNSIRFHRNGTSPLSNGRFFTCLENTIDQQLVINRQGRIRRASALENSQHSARCLGQQM